MRSVSCVAMHTCHSKSARTFSPSPEHFSYVGIAACDQHRAAYSSELMSQYGSTLETQSCVRSINSHGSSVSMNERFARRRGAAVWSFSFPLALRSADRSAERRERLSPNSWSGTTNGVTRAVRAGHRPRPWTCRQITLVGSGAFDENLGSRNSSSPPRFAQHGKQSSISGNLGNGGRAVGKPLATRQDLSAVDMRATWTVLCGSFTSAKAKKDGVAAVAASLPATSVP